MPIVGYLKGAPLRSPLDISFAFASEQTIDELAFAGASIRTSSGGETSATSAGSACSMRLPMPRSGNRAKRPRRVQRRGRHGPRHRARHAHVSYGAAVAEIEVSRDTGNIVAKHLYGALDAGQVINPAFVENQITGR